MSFKKSETTIGTAVATSGTFTISYPANTNAGSFSAYGHKIWVDKFQRLLLSPADFTLSFDTSTITVTYLGSTTIPVGARCNGQFNIDGADDGEVAIRLQEIDTKRSALSSMVKVHLGAADVLDANGVIISQDLTAAGVFSVNVTAAAAIAAGALAGTFDVPRCLQAAWTTTSVLTFTGTDEYGKVIVENSASGTSHTGTKAFKTITDVSASISVTSLTVGTTDVLGLPFYVGNASEIMFELEAGVMLARKPGKVYVMSHVLEAAVDTVVNLEVFSPVAGTFVRLSSVARGAITTGGTVTVEIGTTAVDGLALVIADGAVAGEYDTDTATVGHASTAVTVGERIEIIPSAAFNGAADIFYILEIDVAAGDQLAGTLVVGATGDPTALTGDVRGTYDPFTVANGVVTYDLVINSPDSKYLGLTNFTG